MGFVVEQHLNDSDVKGIKRENWALVYGKNDYMYEVSSYTYHKHPALNVFFSIVNVSYAITFLYNYADPPCTPHYITD